VGSSTGNDKRIPGFEVLRIEIDKVLAPAGLLSKMDRVSVVEAVVDVAALPGMFSSSYSHAHDEAQGVTEAVTAMLATLSGKQAHQHDAQWKTSWKTRWEGSRRRQTWLLLSRLWKTRQFPRLNNKTVPFECSCVSAILITMTSSTTWSTVC
jgi:hypothetical protein